jgi:hypothetical protein
MSRLLAGRRHDSEHLSEDPVGFGITSVQPLTRFLEKESASDAQQSTCEFRPLLRKQMLT